jgi:hypothetical protein
VGSSYESSTFFTGRALLIALVALASCSPSTEPLTEDLGVHQVRVTNAFVPESLAITDTLVAILGGRPDVGNCFTFSHTDIDRDSARVELALWAEARRWLGSGPPPPCGLVDYRYEGLPPFFPDWFFGGAHQPDGIHRVDSVRVVP